MLRDCGNNPSMSKIPNSSSNKKLQLIKSKQKLKAMGAYTKPKELLPKKEPSANNSAPISSQIGTSSKSRVKSTHYTESNSNKSYNYTNDDDPVTTLRKEIQDWRINEILTSGTEERLTGYLSERPSNSFASGATTRRQRSTHYVSKTSTLVDIPAIRKKDDVLEYLDLSSDPAARLIASCRSQRMHSQSLCDCYCKIRVPLTQQREEINSDRSRVRCPKSFVSKVTTSNTSKSAKKVSMMPAKVIDDDQLDTKRSTVTFSVSPVLSPETTAVLEDVEKLIQDAQIQMKEINITTSSGRLRKHVHPYPDEASLDDENDQLLYIRERVACKFQEANGWIDTYYTGNKNNNSSKKGYVTIEPKIVTDLSAPKFKTLEDRYADSSRNRRFDAERLGFPVPLRNDGVANDKKIQRNDNISSTKEQTEKNKKTNPYSVRACPPINIKGELKVQNLDDITITPELSSTLQTQNVASYFIYHETCNRNVSPRRREKFVKIVEDNYTDSHNKRSVNGKGGFEKVIKENSKDCVNNQNGSNSSHDSENVEIRPKQAHCTVPENNGKLGETEKQTNEADESVLTIFRNEKYLQSISVRNLDDGPASDKELDDDKNRSMQGVSNIIQDVGTHKEETKELPKKIVHRNEQKQVRFDEPVLETGSNTNYIELQNKEQVVVNLEGDFNVESSKAFHPCSADKFGVINDNAPLLSEAIEKKHVDNEKSYKEICDKRRLERDNHYKMIDECFTNIVKNYYSRDGKWSKINNASVELSTSLNFTASSDKSDDIYNLYQPAINELDKVLVSYNKIIDNVVRSTKAIDKFLSRPEVEKYDVEDKIQAKNNKKSDVLTTHGRKKNDKTKTSNLHRLQTKKDVDLRKQNAPEANKNWALSNERIKIVKNGPINCPISKFSNKYPNQLNLKMQDRMKTRKTLRKEESTDSSENNTEECKMKLNDEKQNPFSEVRPSQVEEDNSTLTTSSMCPLSSSSETRIANKRKISLEISKSTFKEEAAKLKISTIESRRKNIERDNFDYKALRNIVCSSVYNQIRPEMTNAEQLITRALQEQSIVIENKIKDVFNVNEIVAMIVKSLIENLKSEKSNFDVKDIELLIAENNLTSTIVCANNEVIDMIGYGNLNDDSKGHNLQIEYLPSEQNCSATKTIKCNRDVVEEAESPLFNITPRLEDESSMCEETNSQLNSDGKLFKENCNIKNKIYDEENNHKGVGEAISLQSQHSQGGESTTEKLNLQEAIPLTSNEQTKCREYQTIDEPEKNSITHNETKDVVYKDCTISEGCNEKSVKSFCIENAEKAATACSNYISHSSSSDSLCNCESHRSLSKNSKTLSDNIELLQATKEVKQVSEAKNLVDGEVTNTNSSNLDNIFYKDKILMNVHDEVRTKLLSSTMETNYSSVFNEHFGHSNGISTISTIESKTETPSDTSQSEGEIYLPSSSSYSLGEVRMLPNNRSDGETTDNLGDNITTFVTKEKLTSWNESSKSLIQSIGEI